MRRLLVLHPLLAATLPILFLCAHNVERMDLTGAGAVIAIALFAATALLAVSSVLLRSAARGAAVTTVAIGLFFGYGHALDLLWNWEIFSRFRYAHLTVCAVWLALGTAATWHFSRTREMGRWTVLFSLVLAILVGSSLATIACHRLGGRDQFLALATTPATAQCQTRKGDSVGNTAPLPDIYYIVLDGYGRHDVLLENYEFDNTEFLNQMRSKGFYVAERSCTNYPQTHLSLASSMNLCYLDEQAILRGDEVVFYEQIRNNQIGQILRSLGYRYVHFATTWGGTEFSYLDDTTCNKGALVRAGALTSSLKRSSPLRIIDCFGHSNEAQSHLATLESLPQVASQAGPTFAFAHLICPHPPYVFDRQGRVRSEIDQNDRKSYIDQLVYLNGRINTIVEQILARSAAPPIILLQADHGPGFFSFSADRRDEYDQEFVRERVPILNAYLVPPSMHARLYATITPVNTFRLLFDECFGIPHPLLPDRKFATWYTRPRQVDEVTELFRDGIPNERLAFPTHGGFYRR